MDQTLPLPALSTWEESWNFHIDIERPISPSWSSADTSSTSSQVDSNESNSTYQESPFNESPPGGLDGLYPRVAANDQPVVAVLGVGYVGLHLVTAFSSQYKVIAFDVSEKRLQTVATELSDTTNITLTNDPSQLVNATHFLVAVPTPLIPNTTRIDTSIILKALDTLGNHIRPGSTVVIESSVSVGMTRSLLGKMIRTHNIYGGMSPERVDPGRVSPSYESIPKIVSGLDDLAPGSLLSISSLYSVVFHTIVPVSSPEVAEMTKLYENCQRMVCIAYANEMADACHSLSHPIDPFEVSKAAATKPFGYLPFTPSAGVGGDCIPVNPSYLFSTASFPILQRATEAMSNRPAMLADRAMNALISARSRNNRVFKSKNHKILVVGVAFKPGQSLTTNSPGVGIIKQLLDSWDAHVTFADPLVGEHVLPYLPRLDEVKEWTVPHLSRFDAIIVVVKQTGLDFEMFKELNEKNVLLVQYCQ